MCRGATGTQYWLPCHLTSVDKTAKDQKGKGALEREGLGESLLSLYHENAEDFE